MAMAREFQKCALVMGILSTSEDRREEIILDSAAEDAVQYSGA